MESGGPQASSARTRDGSELRSVHFLRDCLGHARRDQHGLLVALIRPVFNADSQAQARDRLSEAVAHLDGRMGRVATRLEGAEPDILAFCAFPPSHWRKRRGSSDAVYLSAESISLVLREATIAQTQITREGGAAPAGLGRQRDPRRHGRRTPTDTSRDFIPPRC